MKMENSEIRYMVIDENVYWKAKLKIKFKMTKTI